MLRVGNISITKVTKWRLSKVEHIKHAEAERFKGEGITSFEYSTSSEHMNMALIRVNGRHPAEGYISNDASDSLVQVVQGRGVLGMGDGAELPIVNGDQVHLEVGDIYYFEGNMQLVYAASPPWTPEQSVPHN